MAPACPGLGVELRRIFIVMPVIYQTFYPGEADFRAEIVSRGLADLLVCLVGSRGLAMDEACWYVTRDRQRARASIYFSDTGQAQFKVAFVASPALTGWRRPSVFEGRLAARF